MRYFLITYKVGNIVGNWRVVSRNFPTEGSIFLPIAQQLSCQTSEIVILNIFEFKTSADALTYRATWK